MVDLTRAAERTWNLQGRIWSKSRIARLFILTMGLAWAARLGGGLRAQSPSESEMKAVFLYNFVQFVEWPSESFSSSTSPIVIGVLGDDSFADVLERTVEDKTAQGRRFQVKRLEMNGETLRCHLLFISASASKVQPGLAKGLKAAQVLTVAETEGFMQQGGMINFVHPDNKLAFEINRKNAENAGLKISSKLLKLAKTVWD